MRYALRKKSLQEVQRRPAIDAGFHRRFQESMSIATNLTGIDRRASSGAFGMGHQGYWEHGYNAHHHGILLRTNRSGLKSETHQTAS